MTQKWLLDRYESGSELAESKFTILNDLGLLVAWGTFSGGAGYVIKAAEDLPSLTGAQVHDVIDALQTMSEEAAP